MNNKIEAALNYDPLHEAERCTGLHSAESESTLMLGALLALDSGAHKDRVLREADDVSMRSTLADWLDLVNRLEFEPVLDESIPGTEDRYRIFWRSGVLMTMDSYFGDTSVNSASARFNFKGPREALFRCSSDWACEIDGAPVWTADFDAREALRYRLEKLEAEGELLSKWVKRGFLWLLHYQDTKQEGYDYNAINAERLAKLPEHVRDAITPEPDVYTPRRAEEGEQ